MSIVKCSECGGNVSTTAPVCPHCGAPRLAQAPPPSPAPPPSRQGTSPWTIIGWIFLGFMLLVMYGCYQVFKPGGPMDPQRTSSASTSSAPQALPPAPYELTILSFECRQAGDDTRAEITVRNDGTTNIEMPKAYFGFDNGREDSLFDPITIPPGAMATAFARHPGSSNCTIVGVQDRSGVSVNVKNEAK